MGTEKSLFVTYILWLFLGLTGIHHFYLRRDKQAFIWWTTCGGFWFGWFRDMWRIPQYLDDVNEEYDFMDDLKRKMKLRKEPQFNIIRFIGQLLMGYFYGVFARLALPEETPLIIVGLLTCIGFTAGIYMVGCIGREEGPFLSTYLVSVLCFFCLTYLTGEEGSYMYSVVAASCTFNYYRKYKPLIVGKRKKLCVRISHVSFGASVFFTLWVSFLYFNAAITYKDGEKIHLRDAVSHFFKSPAWLDFKNTMWEIYEKGSKEGWSNNYHEFVKAFDPTGEANALKVLDLTSKASAEDIRRTYKKLVIKWHPDRYKGDDKEGAQKHFMEIQKAYEILSQRKKKSKSRNDRDRTEF